VAPTKENIQNGTYPFIANFYAVTNGMPVDNTKLLIDIEKVIIDIYSHISYNNI